MIWTAHEVTGGTAGLTSVVKLQVPLGGLGAEERRKGRVGEEEDGRGEGDGGGREGWREGMENDYIHIWIMIFIFESTV